MAHADSRYFPARIFLFLLAIVLPGLASANSPDYSSLSSRYPTFASNFGCGACHNGSPPALTSYGQAYKTAVGGGRGNSTLMNNALAGIEPADSDGDGYKNIAEINGNVYNPGSAASHPTASVALSSLQTAKTGTASSTVSYTVTVTNNGNITDSFTLGVSVVTGQSWAPSISGSAINVVAGGTANITVNVAVSSGATAGQFSVARVTAASQANTGISATPLDLTTSVASVVATNRYVNASTGVNTGACTSPGAPCKTITYAMSQSPPGGTPGDTINVAAGTYNAALGESFPIGMVSGVLLKGTSGAGSTFIDLSGANARAFNWTGTNSSTLLEGFWMKNALLQPGADGSLATGGAILLTNSAAGTIQRNIFDVNEVRGYAGTGSSFVSGGEAYGGAIHSSNSTPAIQNNIFYGNTARGGTGKSNPGTSTPGSGGGSGQAGAIYIYGGGTIINNTFVGNSAIGGAGGFSLGAGGNGGYAYYGAVYASGASVVNNIFVNNSVTGGTGGGSSPSGSTGFVSYSALSYNDAPSATHNLFFQNIENGVAEAGAGGNTVGSNFLIANPEFVSPPANLHINLTSPARASGTPTGAPANDFDGVTRPNPPSRGAFEAIGPAYSVTDFNDDGRSDMLWRNSSTGQIFRFLMNGFTFTSGAFVWTESNLDWKIVADADFNGDGVADILWRNSTTGQVYMLLFNNTGNVSAGAMVYQEANPAWKIVATPDFNGDGKADILWWNSSTGQVYAMLMDGFTVGTQGFVWTEPNLSWNIVAVGDFAGSGKRNQLLWRNSATGAVFLMTVTLNGNTFSTSGGIIYNSQVAYKVVAAADFNGDGKTDVLWRNDNTGAVYMFLMKGSTVQSEGQIWVESNQDWKIVAAGDYNGDTKADILWRNQTTGQVFMMLMNGLSVTNASLIYQEANTAWKILGPHEYRVP